MPKWRSPMKKTKVAVRLSTRSPMRSPRVPWLIDGCRQCRFCRRRPAARRARRAARRATAARCPVRPPVPAPSSARARLRAPAHAGFGAHGMGRVASRKASRPRSAGLRSAPSAGARRRRRDAHQFGQRRGAVARAPIAVAYEGISDRTDSRGAATTSEISKASTSSRVRMRASCAPLWRVFEQPVVDLLPLLRRWPRPPAPAWPWDLAQVGRHPNSSGWRPAR